jgi:hypothetical protein
VAPTCLQDSPRVKKKKKVVASSEEGGGSSLKKVDSIVAGESPRPKIKLTHRSSLASDSTANDSQQEDGFNLDS